MTLRCRSWRRKSTYERLVPEPPVQGQVRQDVSKYLIEYRLEKSRELLEKTILKVSDIAAHVGYNDVSHYIQSFRKVYGVTPEQYRNSLEKPEK